MLEAETYIIDRLRAAMLVNPSTPNMPAASGVCVKHVDGLAKLDVEQFRQFSPAIWVIMDTTAATGDAHSAVLTQRYATVVTIQSSTSQAQSPMAAMQAATPILRALLHVLHGWQPQDKGNIGNGSPLPSPYSALKFKATLKPDFHNGFWAIPVIWETSQPLCASSVATNNLPITPYPGC